MTEAVATISAGALVAKKFHSFEAELAKLEEFNHNEVFDYESKDGNKDARSHVAKLRKVKASIERARKEAKADALEYGRKVDAEAKKHSDRIVDMIELHDKPLREIKERFDRKKSNLELCETEDSREMSSGELRSLFNKIDAIDPEGDIQVEIAKEDSLKRIASAITEAVSMEKQEAYRQAELRELERLRKEKAEREAQEQREAEDRARQEEAIRQANAREKAEKEAAILREERAKREKAEAEKRAAEAEERARQAVEEAADLRAQKIGLPRVKDVIPAPQMNPPRQAAKTPPASACMIEAAAMLEDISSHYTGEGAKHPKVLKMKQLAKELRHHAQEDIGL